MALTRAQLLMGNSSQGVVLTGQTQGVRQGVGVIIAADGTISFDSVTATGVLKTNNPTAYNAYVWPTTLGAVGQQLQLGAGGTLFWEDPDQIPWTAKGQLIAGTGVGTSTLLNVGVDGSILIADSTQSSGLGYTTNFVTSWSGGGTGLTPSAATKGAVTLGGVLSIGSGGTGQTTASAAANALLPSQSGNVSKVLTTDGSNLSWAPTVSSLTAGSNITLSGSTGNITISASGGGGGGTITAVNAGTNLTGGGSSGSVTLGLNNNVSISGQFTSSSTGGGSSAGVYLPNGMVRSQDIVATNSLQVSPNGSNVWFQSGTESNVTFNSGATQLLQISNSGQVNNINTTTASYNVNRTNKGSLYVFYYVAGGSALWGVDQNGTAGPPSDISLKTNITPLLSLPGSYLDKVCDLTPVRFEYIGAPGLEKFGLIAQDAELYAPELVNEAVLPATNADGEFDSDLDPVADGTTIKNVDYQGLSILTLQALKELKAEFDAYVAAHP